LIFLRFHVEVVVIIRHRPEIIFHGTAPWIFRFGNESTRLYHSRFSVGKIPPVNSPFLDTSTPDSLKYFGKILLQRCSHHPVLPDKNVIRIIQTDREEMKP
jgi:hypothetical protein